MESPSNPEVELPEFVRREFEPGGFMHKCRHLQFEREAGERFVASIDSVNVEALSPVDRGNVALAIFDLPFLLAAWREKSVESGIDATDYSCVMRDIHRTVGAKMKALLLDAKGP